MAKLYFKYGAMGSSKTATALITKYNYEERGMRVWLIKPAASSLTFPQIFSQKTSKSIDFCGAFLYSVAA